MLARGYDRGSAARCILMKALNQERLDWLFELWDRLADYHPSEIDKAHEFLMAELATRIRADNVVWIGGVRMLHGARARRDTQNGWRGRSVRILRPSPVREQQSRESIKAQDRETVLTTQAITATAGRFRVHRMRDGFVDFEAFRQTPHYRNHYEALGLTDRIWAVSPVNPDAESYFLFDLRHARRRFTETDARLVGHALRGIKWFHRRLLLSHGLLLADDAFTPAQRRVLALLLTEATEAEIAAQLDLAKGTVHQYAVDLYRKLGVRGRAGLMSLWLGQ